MQAIQTWWILVATVFCDGVDRQVAFERLCNADLADPCHSSTLQTTQCHNCVDLRVVKRRHVVETDMFSVFLFLVRLSHSWTRPCPRSLELDKSDSHALPVPAFSVTIELTAVFIVYIYAFHTYREEENRCGAKLVCLKRNGGRTESECPHTIYTLHVGLELSWPNPETDCECAVPQ